MKGWQVVADNLKKAELNSDWVSALDLEGRMIWIVDAHRQRKRFAARADRFQRAARVRQPCGSYCCYLREPRPLAVEQMELKA